MQITGVKHFRPTVGMRPKIIVKIETDAGIYGLGEAGTAGREIAVGGMFDHYRQFLIGRDPRQIEEIHQILYRGQYFEGGTIITAATSAIDIALWDILGKHLKTPIWQLLGGASRQKVTCFADAVAGEGDTLVDRAANLVEQGWKAIRFTPVDPSNLNPGEWGGIYEPWESVVATAELMHHVRARVGASIRLSVDFHHRLSVADAAEFCRLVDDVNLMFLEEPIRSESPDAYASLRQMTSIPFAIGEEFSGIHVFAPFIERGLSNYVRLDVCNVGGFTAARKVAGMAEAHYLDVMPHNPLGPISTAAAVHLCSAIPNFALLEYNWHTKDRPPDLFPTGMDIEVDAFSLPEAPGLGVTLNEDAIEDFPFEFWEAPQWRRHDGSYTNW
jgi:galactonate dehydratase